MAHEPKKLTLANGGFVAPPPGTEFRKLSDGFWTCGAGCPHPGECLAKEHCKRGFVGNAVGFTGGMGEGSSAEPKKLTPAAARDAAWQAFFAEHDLRKRGFNSLVVADMRVAFNAGWASRKKAELEMAYGLDKPKAE